MLMMPPPHHFGVDLLGVGLLLGGSSGRLCQHEGILVLVLVIIVVVVTCVIIVNLVIILLVGLVIVACVVVVS
jgi:hypothetical protein